MENKIELNKSNYKNYLPINMIAFSYAGGGAQGDPGAILIVDTDGKIFYLNHAFGDLNENEVNEICPPLKDIVKGEKSEGFHRINMGMGNTLYIGKSILQKFQEETKDINTPSGYYLRWIKVVLNIIKNN